MKRIIVKQSQDTIDIENVSGGETVFAKKDGRLKGMIVKEDKGWILRLGYTFGASGHHETFRECIEVGLRYGYEFYVED